ncbi:septum site-determining protein Ssd [Luteococcus sediminum]
MTMLVNRRAAAEAGTRPGHAAGPGRTAPLLVSRDPMTIESTLAAGSACGVEPSVLREPTQVRAAWRSASSVLVGVEMAALVEGLQLEPRPGVHLVGREATELLHWSARLQAAVLLLGEQTGQLVQVLRQGDQADGDALVVRLVGGSGGLGVSTLCCALAQQAAERGMAAAVVELDPTGGGLDLVFGAETAPGWRWRDLRQAAGHVDSLVGRLPNVSGVDIVAHTRGELAAPTGSGGPPGGSPGRVLPAEEAVRAVVGSLARTHDIVVLDQGAGDGGWSQHWPGQRQVLLCGADVRGVVAARSRAASLGLHDVELVVRTGAARRIAPELVADTLGIALLGSIGDDRSVTRAVEQGVPVGRGRRGYARQVAGLLNLVVP